MKASYHAVTVIAIVLLALMGLAGLSGCGGGGGSDEPTYSTTLYFPLTQSNWWSYNVTQYDLDVQSASISTRHFHHPFAGRELLSLPDVNTVSAQSDVGVGVLLLQVTGTKNVEGETWYQLTSTLQNSAEPAIVSYFRHDLNGLKTRVEPDGSEPYAYYRIKTPLILNNQWYPFEDFDDVSHIAGVHESVTVPAGTFSDCLWVIEEWQAGGHDYRIETWWVQNIGLVRSDDYTDDVLAGTTELAAYSIVGD